jgi:hypothetical protein
MKSPLGAVLWSIAFPGFGQISNGCIIKGILFIGLEFYVNGNANINEVIVLSFNGLFADAIQAANYQWIMFYPCIYTFAIWDAFLGAGGGRSSLSVLPAVFSAYFGTLGVVFSREAFTAWPALGPIWLGLIGMAAGAAVGWLIKTAADKKQPVRRDTQI